MRLLLLLVIPILFSTSCQKMLDVPSTRLVEEKNMWLKQEDARAGLMGVYGLARAALGDNTRHWLYGDVRKVNGQGGDFNSVQRLDIKAIADNSLRSSYPLVRSLANWRRFYAVINAANIFLERAPQILKTDFRYQPADLKLDIAHARVVRAFTYFYMVRIWGDVPFMVSSHDGKFENKPREDQNKILAFVESELLAAVVDLPYAYNKGNVEQPRATYYADEEEMARKSSVYAILAHVYAWQGKYAESAVCSKWVLDNMANPLMGGQNQLLTGSVDQVRRMFRGEFGSNQWNILFGFSRQFYSMESFTTGSLEELTLAAPYIMNKSLPAIFVPKDSILKIYNESNDARFSINPVTGAPGSDETFGAFDRAVPIFTKVFIISANFPPVNTTTGPGSDGSIATFGSSTVFSRPEDMAFLLAEASVVLGDKTTALQLLNDARARRGLPVYDAAKHGTILQAIFNERRRELIGEGWRWYDYIRYKKILNNDPKFAELVNNGGIYWPIAQEVLDQNPLLSQYPYWKNN